MSLPLDTLTNIITLQFPYLWALLSDKVSALDTHSARDLWGPQRFRNENTNFKAIISPVEVPSLEINGSKSFRLLCVFDSIICSRIQLHKLIKPH